MFFESIFFASFGRYLRIPICFICVKGLYDCLLLPLPTASCRRILCYENLREAATLLNFQTTEYHKIVSPQIDNLEVTVDPKTDRLHLCN